LAELLFVGAEQEHSASVEWCSLHTMVGSCH